uniref:Peptidyl-prolyl cis-trans isomerase n=1 Tax=Jaculus jaculus TaxID=51337 RepID=A0A8C5KX26_JACJA
MAVANSSPVNPVVFFDVSTGDQELFADIVTKRAKNFKQFCAGEFRKYGVPIGYKGSAFHGVIKYFMIQGGDFVNGDGTGVTSIYQGPFPDEKFKLKHSFFFACSKYGKHVLFGKIMDGLLVMRKVENVATGPNNKPKLPVVISQCGDIIQTKTVLGLLCFG